MDAAALAGSDVAAPASSMVDDAYGTLLSAIVEARLAAGTPLSQNKLAARMGVSRTPVREALLRLERDGLVQRHPDTGFVVASITPAEVEEACDLLQLLDTFVYVRASAAMSPAVQADLLALAATLVEHADAADTAAWRDADRRYHRLITEAAGNRFVADYLQQTRRRVQRFWLHKPDFDGRLRICSQDHVTLARAVADRDEQVLADAVRAHIERLRANVLARLESVGPLLPGPDPLASLLPAPTPEG
jgi:DNA-binding GntR family transcriptional regulator